MVKMGEKRATPETIDVSTTFAIPFYWFSSIRTQIHLLLWKYTHTDSFALQNDKYLEARSKMIARTLRTPVDSVELLLPRLNFPKFFP